MDEYINNYCCKVFRINPSGSECSNKFNEKFNVVLLVMYATVFKLNTLSQTNEEELKKVAASYAEFVEKETEKINSMECISEADKKMKGKIIYLLESTKSRVIPLSN